MADQGRTALLPSVSQAEKARVKQLLKELAQTKRFIAAFEEEAERLGAEQLEQYERCKREVKLIERAIPAIPDDEVRRIVDYRFVKGHSYTATVRFFGGCMSDRTVERKLNEGIAFVARMLRMWTN